MSKHAWRLHGAWQKIYRHMTVHRAWVADFRGSGCDTWTEIRTH